VSNEKKGHTRTGLPAIHLADEETTVESPASLKAVLLAGRSRTAAAFPFREIIGKKTRLDRRRPSRGKKRRGRAEGGRRVSFFRKQRTPGQKNAAIKGGMRKRGERAAEEKENDGPEERRGRAPRRGGTGRGRSEGWKKRRMRWTRQKPRNVTCLFFTIEAHCS